MSDSAFFFFLDDLQDTFLGESPSSYFAMKEDSPCILL